MNDIPNIKSIYTKIQHQLYALIPEKWESIYLYASIMKQFNNWETWEMYFYYIPKGFLNIKRNAINVYEVPNRFNVDEQEYLKLVDNLCNTIKELYVEYKNTYEKDWSNLVLSIKDSQFLIEYKSDKSIFSKYSSNDRHIIFKYEYLDIPIQHFNKEERKTIEEYLNDNERNVAYDRHLEYISIDNNIHNYIEYGRENEFDTNIEENQLVVVKKKRFSFWDFFRRKQEHVKELIEPKIQVLKTNKE